MCLSQPLNNAYHFHDALRIIGFIPHHLNIKGMAVLLILGAKARSQGIKSGIISGAMSSRVYCIRVHDQRRFLVLPVTPSF